MPIMNKIMILLTKIIINKQNKRKAVKNYNSVKYVINLKRNQVTLIITTL